MTVTIIIINTITVTKKTMRITAKNKLITVIVTATVVIV